jgi:hypothetical protein
VLRSEWIKIRSVRSTVWALVAMVVALVGGAAFAAVGIVVRNFPPAATAVATDPSGGTVSGAGLAQLRADPGCPVEGALPPGTGLAVYAGYAVITLLAAALVLRRRDA